MGAVITVFLGLILLIPLSPPKPPLGNGLILSSFDFPFRFASPKAPDDVRIIYMDEASHAKLGQSLNRPWHRSLHAQLLKELTARGARAVVFDILFDAP